MCFSQTVVRMLPRVFSALLLAKQAHAGLGDGRLVDVVEGFV